MDPSQFKYKQKSAISLHPNIEILSQLLSLHQPSTPPLLTRKIAQESGLQLNENTLTLFLSHLMDYKIHSLMEKVKESKERKSKKGKSILTKGDVVKAIIAEGQLISVRGNVYVNLGKTEAEEGGVEQQVQEEMK